MRNARPLASALVLGSIALALAGCGGPAPMDFTGAYVGVNGGGFVRDAAGRRVDLDASSTGPSVPTSATAGFGR